jgi:tetratricopeptide (TPR) repeat protein
MDTFDKVFGEKENNESPASTTYLAAKKAFEKGDYRESLRLQMFAFNVDPNFMPTYELAVLALEKLGGKTEADLFKKALEDFNNYKPFYNLGYHFTGVGNYRMAIPFLQRSLALSNNSLGVAMELAIAYTAQFLPEKGMELLKQINLDNNFWALCQLHWCSLLSSQPDGIEEFISNTKKQFKDRLNMQDKNIAAVFAAIDKLEECLNRYKTVQNPEYIIRIWHYIQYGSAILDYFDNSVAENALQVAGGRYVAKFGSYKEVKLVISKLEKYLIKLDKVPTTVYILPSRNSEILSKAISKILGVDCIQYIRNTPVQNGLIVAGDTSEFNDYPELVNIRGNTVTFALNHNWLDNSLITPDICGFMSQTYIFPWEGGSVKVNPETKQVDKSEPDLRSAEEIAHSIASEEVEINPEFNEILEFYYERKDYMKGGLKDTFKRLHYNTDSPVKGSYFW